MGAEASTYQQLRSYLAYLKLTAAAEQLAAALEQRRLDGRLRLAGFPSTKTLEQFDFDAQPALDRRLVDELATLRFIEERANVLAIGPPGVGQTMLAIALCLKAVHAGYRVYYTTAADLVARTNRAAIDGRWQTTMRFWNGPQLLVIDLCRHRGYAEPVTSRRYEAPANRLVLGARAGPDVGIVTGSRGRPGGRPGACSGRV